MNSDNNNKAAQQQEGTGVTRLLLFLVILACLIVLGCSPQSLPAKREASTPESLAGTPATADPLAERRAQVLTRIGALTDSDCDFLVLRFQLIPRDEILEPISNPRKDLLRYVQHIVSDEELATIEHAVNDRKQTEKPVLSRESTR